MNDDIHSRARKLIAESRSGTIAKSELAWLDGHMRGCAACYAAAGAMDEAIQSLRAMPVRLNSAMVEATRIRVQARAREFRAHRLPRVWLWLACALSWGWITVSGQWLWHGFAGMARSIGLPSPFWQMAFMMWWVMPALVAAAALSYRSLQGADSARNG